MKLAEAPQRALTLALLLALATASRLAAAQPDAAASTVASASAEVPVVDPLAKVPTIEHPVTDRANVLSPEAKEAIASKIVAHRQATGVQIAVLVIHTTGAVPIEDYAMEVATAWGGGTKGQDNGVLYVLALTDRRSRLEVGYGLEAQLPDAVARRIQDGAKTALRSGDHATAVDHVVSQLIARTGGAPTPAATPPPSKPPESGPGLHHIAVFYLSALALGSLVGCWLGRERRRRKDAKAKAAVAEGHTTASESFFQTFALLAWVPAGAVVGLGIWLLELPPALAAPFGLGMLFGYYGFARRKGFDNFFLAFRLGFALVFGCFAGLVGYFVIGNADLALLIVAAIHLFASQFTASEWFASSSKRSPDRSRRSSATSPSSSSLTFGSSSWSSSSSSSSMFGSSSSSMFGSSSSSMFGSSSSSSSWSGGGGSFGGGGASSSW